MNINSAKTGSRACKPSGGVSIDSPRAVRRAFSAELSWWQQVSSTLPFVNTQMIKKTRLKGREWKPLPEIHTSNFVTLDNVCWNYSLFTQTLPTTIPNCVAVWFPPATPQFFLPFLKSLTADMAGKEQWVMATVSCHQFCQDCAEVQWKKWKQSLSYSVEPNGRAWHSFMHYVHGTK